MVIINTFYFCFLKIFHFSTNFIIFSMEQKCSGCLSSLKALVNNSSIKYYRQIIFFFSAEIPDFLNSGFHLPLLEIKNKTFLLMIF